MRAMLDLAYENVLPATARPCSEAPPGTIARRSSASRRDSVRDEAELDLIDDQRVRCRARLDPQQQAHLAVSSAGVISAEYH